MSARPQPALDLLRKRVDALYRTDAGGRIVCTNEWDARPAPRFHLMRTAEGPIAKFRADLPVDLVRALEAVSAGEPWDGGSGKLPNRHALPSRHAQYLELLAAHAPVERVWSGPAYMAATGVSPTRPPIAIDGHNAHLLQRRFKDWLADVPHRHPFMAGVEGGDAVSICASVRISRAVHCAGVETHPDYRRRGHALDVVAGWAAAVRSLGATPFYSTSWDNLASQAVANRLGFVMVGADFHVM